jgi:hypothetical protein
MPSPFFTSGASIRPATPVFGFTVYSLPVKLWTMISRLPFGVAAMPLALNSPSTCW